MISHRSGFEVDLDRGAGPNTLIQTRSVGGRFGHDYVITGVMPGRDVERIGELCVDRRMIPADLGLSDIPGPWEEIVAVRTTDAVPNVRPDCCDLMIAFGRVDALQWSRPAPQDDFEDSASFRGEDGSDLCGIPAFR